MIIAENKNKKVVTSHDFDSINCTIDAEDMRYVASLLRNNYSNTQLAVVREISANALDANTEAKSKRRIEITLPSKLSTNFCVRDFGGGLSQQDVFGLYSKYGKSTKRTSNNYIGAFGIGKFAPLSYGDNFTCVSYHGGIKSSYNIFVDEHDDTKIVKLHEEPSNEPTGLEVQVAISESDIESFRDNCKKFFKFFPDKDMPKFIGAEKDFVEKPKVILEGENADWFFTEQESSYNYYSRSYEKAKVIMGRVAYPLDADSIDIKNYVQDESQASIIRSVIQESNFHLRVPLGCVKLHHSREALEYNKPTQKFIAQRMVEVMAEVKAIASEKLSDSQDLYEAKANYARIINSLPQTLQRAFEGSFEWQGIKIDSFGFSRPYGMTDDIILTETTREKDSDARNGFRVRSNKTSRINCRDDGLFIIQDISSSHGNNLRARTLFNEDENLQVVYFINALTDDAQALIDDKWHFDSISDKHIRYTSKVAKEKPDYSGVRKSNGSRAHIPLFEMKKEGYSYRNIDYWKSVNDDIATLQENGDKIEGSVNGKLVYIPIKNYKIDYEDYELKTVYELMQRIHSRAEENSQEKTFRLIGVRAGDVSKLDKSSWINFFDFLTEHCKEYLLRNASGAKQSYNKFLVNSSKHNEGLRESSYTLDILFSDRRFPLDKLSKDNPIVSNKTNYEVTILGKTCFECCFCINYLAKKHKDWLEFNLDSGFDVEQFASEILSITKQYPLLKVMYNSVSSYRTEQETFDDWIDYILLCDKK